MLAPTPPDSERYLRELEGAVLHAAATGSPDASRRLDEERRRSADGLARVCLELLRRRGWGDAGARTTGADGRGLAQHDAVAFYALTTLQRSPLLACAPPAATATADDFAALRSQLRHMILTTISHPHNLHCMPSFVATKIGVLLALLVREEYPISWASPWRDALDALGLSGLNGIAADAMASSGMYLSFLDAVSDEIVYPAADDAELKPNLRNERFRREQVKDALRGFPISQSGQTSAPVEPRVPIEQTDAAHIVGWMLNVLVTLTQPQNNDEMVGIAVRSAATMKRYLSWIDLRLATNKNLIHMLLVGLGGASQGDSGDDDMEEPTQRTLLAVECAHCLREIVDRGMEERSKLALLAELDVFGTLCLFSKLEVAGSTATSQHNGNLDLITDDGTQVEAVAAAAELINAAGLSLIQGWEIDPSSMSTNIQMKQCLELALACLSYDSIDVSGVVVDLFSRILTSLEKKEECWNRLHDASSTNGDTICNTILSRILLILHQRMKYPDDFVFDYEDEEDAEEELYRSNLRKLYQRIVRLRPEVVLQFIGEFLSSIPQPWSSSATPDIEVALRLVYHYGEGRRPAPGAKTALKDSSFREMVTALHRSDVAHHPHREVLLLYYDLCVRYSALLRESPELLTLFLGSLYGNRGLQHPHPRVRCRCCYLLLRTVKLVGAKSMKAHVEVIVEGIQNLLFPSAQSELLPIPPDEALYLFETTGLLLGTTGLDKALQVRCVTAVLTPHIRSIEETLQSPDLTHDVESYGEKLSMSLSAIAQLSKGWQKHPPCEVQAVLAAAVDVCRSVIMAVPSSPAVRNKTAVLLQRMILCLGEAILPAMPSFFDPLLSHCTLEEDVLDASQLINQLCIKFKEKAAASIDASLRPFLQRVLAVQLAESTVSPGSNGASIGGNDISPPPHLITEQLFIRKQAFATLQHIALHNVSAVLYSETNMTSLRDVLHLMSDGATGVPDLVMRKTCSQFFCELISQWGGATGQQALVPPTHISDIFFDFVYEIFVPGMVGSILDTSFDVRDALHCRVLAEFGRALWFLKQSRQARFQSRAIEPLVTGQVSGGMKASPAILQGFLNATGAKDMELILKAWKEELP
ncbi:hypothetical protein ACHAWF_010756 [Thalassiosira exigua]